ncbi:MAG TPA: DNA-binding protein [Verrucomicrobiae bacterium]
MPKQSTIKRARKDERQGKSPSTQAGEFVREEFHHIRKGKHGARSAKQAIAIGLSKARRAGVGLAPPSRGRFSGKVRRQAERDFEKGQHHKNRRVSRRRSKATLGALRREGRQAGSSRAISRQAHDAAQRRSSSDRRAAAQKAVRTKDSAGLSIAGRKAARTRRMAH